MGELENDFHFVENFSSVTRTLPAPSRPGFPPDLFRLGRKTTLSRWTTYVRDPKTVQHCLERV